MIKKYDRESAILYSQEYALKRNPKYLDFHSLGGDCTNFISQCLLAGGAVMNFSKNFGWFYVSSNNRSASWTSVLAFQNFLLHNNGVGPFGQECEIEYLQVGDLIQLRQNPNNFNHTLIVSSITNEDICVCAHSDDSLNRSLKDYYYLQMRGIHIEGIRLS